MRNFINHFHSNLRVDLLRNSLFLLVVFLQSNISFGQALGVSYGSPNQLFQFLTLDPILSADQRTVQHLNIKVSREQNIKNDSGNLYCTGFTLSISEDNGASYTPIINDHQYTNNYLVPENASFPSLNQNFGSLTYHGIHTEAGSPTVDYSRNFLFALNNYDLNFHNKPHKILFRLVYNYHNSGNGSNQSVTHDGAVEFRPNYASPVDGFNSGIPYTKTDNQIVYYPMNLSYTPLSSGCAMRWMYNYQVTQGDGNSTFPEEQGLYGSFGLIPRVFDNLGPNKSLLYYQIALHQSDYSTANITLYQSTGVTTDDVPIIEAATINNKTNASCNQARISFSPLISSYIDSYEYKLYDQNDVEIASTTASHIDLDISSYSLGEVMNLKLKTMARYSSSVWHESVAYLPIEVNRLNSPTLPTNFSLEYSEVNDGVVVSWDNINGDPTVDEFDIFRGSTNINNGPITNNAAIISADAFSQSFTDNSSLQNCSTYEYTIVTKSCGLQTSTEAVPITINTGLSNTFTTALTDSNPKNLSVSKGYFADKVDLTWENNNNALIQTFIVKRRLSSSSILPWTTLAQLDNTAHYYVDEYAESGKFYEYQVTARVPCGLNEDVAEEYSSISTGYRVPEASVSGSINFEGANAVENVKVSVNSTATNTNKSLVMNGTNYIDITDVGSSFSSNVNDNSVTFSTWIKSVQQPDHIYNIFSIGHEYLIVRHGNTIWVVTRNSTNSGHDYVTGYDVGTELDNWGQLTVAYDHTTSSSKIYINGDLRHSIIHPHPPEISNFHNLSIGTPHYTHSIIGNLDEIRIWNRALTAEEVTNSYDRYIAKNEEGLIAMYHCDEGLGNNIYDQSKSEIGYNKHNGQFVGSISYSEDVPSISELSNYALTDENGNYIIEGIRYGGSGSNFTVTPQTTNTYYDTPHEFEPTQRVVYLGDGNATSDGQNFTDISSFRLTGSVYFHDLHDYNNNGNVTEIGNCPVSDVVIKIDGEPVVLNGEIVMSDAEGNFDINVPIGKHIITVEKNGHTFSQGIFPNPNTAPFIDTHDFQEQVSGIIFTDNTVIKVAGRAVGGVIEGDKKLGHNLSVNNIGVVNFKYISQNTKDTLAVQTNSVSGEYLVDLLPIPYQINDFNSVNNSGVNGYSDFQAFEVLNLSYIPGLTDVIDTIFAADGFTISEINSASYHFKNSFVYRAAPSIRVLNNTKSAPFTADSQIVIDSIPFTDLTGFGNPIFTQNNNYESFIVAEEVYQNSDGVSPVINRVPISTGQFVVTNNLAVQSASKTILLDAVDGAIAYDFRGGIPNLLVDGTNPSYSFTKTWDISFETGPYTVAWLPDGQVYRGIIFGAKSEGTSFVTNGPQVVSRILRDPPGSGSFAFYEAGTTVSQASTVSTNLGASLGTQNDINLGTKFLTGVGVITETSIEVSSSMSNSISTSIGHAGEYIESTTFTSGFSTSADNEGMGMDVYMGRSMNMNFGISTNLTLINLDECALNLPAIECIGESIGAFKIGTRKGFFAVPGGYGTEFYYTQYEIIEGLIPELKLLRDNYFVADDRYDVTYVSSFTGENNPEEDENNDSLKCVDNIGASYSFVSSDGTAQVDSVVWYNQQIRLWTEAIAHNEKLKLNAVPVSNGAGNISFDGGVGDISYTYENNNSSANSITWEIEIGAEFSTAVGGNIGGVGGSSLHSMGITVNNSGDHTFSNESSTSVGFTLSDGDLDDKYSIDILDDGTAENGKVFKVIGGRTSCPYFDGDYTLYYLPGEELSASTVQMDQPSISISPSSMSNVPEDEPAVFNLSLGNINPLNYDREYLLKVKESSNPNGAIIKIDGLNPNRTFEVPAGTTFNKVLTVEKGPEALDYQEIEISFLSVCDPGISESILLSVSFLPGCTDVEILNPDPNWVINSGDIVNDSTFMNILVSDYNYNYYSLNNIAVQYKETNSSNWVLLETFYKNTDSTSIIPTSQSNISIPWDLSDLPDGDYDIRAITDCNLASEETNFYSGHVDRVRPHSFGSPSPADGILDPNDDLQISFNENIKETDLGDLNFSLSGILNGSEIRHDASLYFDGDVTMTIPTGLNLQNKSFTIEMWINAESTGDLFQQGYLDGNSMTFAIKPGNKLKFRMGDVSIESTTLIELNEWVHVASSFNIETNKMDFFINGELQNPGDGGYLLTNYTGEGPVVIGNLFTGSIHGLRVWSEAKSGVEIYSNMLQSKSGNEPNLLGCWPMDELVGTPIDISRSRNANTSATWQVSEEGKAYNFSASNQEYLQANSPTFREHQDFTIELWFKANGGNQTILSNGSLTELPDSTFYGNKDAWTIATNANGNIEVKSNFETLTSVETFDDDNWHYLALVKKDLSTTYLYIDGQEQSSLNSNLINGFGGSDLILGAYANSSSVSTTYSNYLNGSIDEVRIWNKARSLSQLNRDARAKLNGDENGLVAYYPFENYALNEFYVYQTYTSLNDEHTNTSLYSANNLSGSGSFVSTDIPLIRRARSVEKVNYSYSSNNDKIIFTIEDALNRVEGCILDIEVNMVKDLYGNQMSSPETWTAYVNQNQLLWDDQFIEKEKLFGEPLVFETYIVNQGGTVENFEVSNLPIWLTTNPSEGLLEPNSFALIEFVVNESLFIGDYSQDIMLTGNNAYAERFELKLIVEAEQPDFALDINAFEYSMNFVGKVSVDGIRSRDDKDILFTYVGDELRGATELIYIEDYDSYFVFHSVYSNSPADEVLEFKLWDASQGKMQVNVQLNGSTETTFTDGIVVGDFSSLSSFEALNRLEQVIPLSEGWNWMSFNLDETNASDYMQDLAVVFADVTKANVEVFKNQTTFTQFGEVGGNGIWYGSLASDNVPIEQMYMLKIEAVDTISYSGLPVLPNGLDITINTGWNWIGYFGQRRMGINEALSSLNPTTSDIIKSKSAFSMYANENLGWLGSLSTMESGEGYMFRSAESQTLTYPESSMIPGGAFRIDGNKFSNDFWKVDPHKYQNSMSIIARIEHDNFENTNTESVLGAFIGAECVGNISSTKISDDETLYFITIYGDDQDPIRFDYYDVENEKIYRADNLLVFEANNHIGSFSDPYPISINFEQQNLDLFFDFSLYPNPFTNGFDLEFNLEESAIVEVKLFDVMGRFVKMIVATELVSGSQKIHIESESLTKGLYFIELQIGGESFRKKIVKS